MHVRILCLLMVGSALVACNADKPKDPLVDVRANNMGITNGRSLTWHAVSSDRPAAPELIASGNVLQMKLAGFYLGSKQVDGRDFSRVLLPGHGPLTVAGYPELPRVRANVIIPHRVAVDFEVIDSEYFEIPLEAPLPSRGDITRDMDPARVPYRPAEFYRSGKRYPLAEALVEKPFILRDYRGLTIQFQPFIYDRVRGTLVVYTRIRVRFLEGTVRLGAERRETPEFANLYRSTFVNYSANLRYDPIAEPGRLVIITADAFYDAILPLRDWKVERGLRTTVVRLSDIGASASDIRAFIRDEYNSLESLTYVILVGDSDTIPTLQGGHEGAHSDPTYVMIDGDDYYADLFISRISARSLSQVETQVAKFIGYERDPDPQAGWYTRGIGIASDEGSPTDYQRADDLRDSLLGYGYTDVAQVYDPGATAYQVTTEVNRGLSIMNYIGHGSGTSWVTSSMDTGDVSNLSNNGMLPFVIDVSCLNGSFVNHDTCFAEAWLRAGTADQPAGAVAMFSASTNASWVPPCVMQTWIVDELLVGEQRYTAGGMYFGGAMKVLDQYGDSEGRKLVEQYNLFGDATLMVRTKVPQQIGVQHPDSLDESGTLSVTVTGSGGSPLAGATVALSDGEVIGTASTAPDGSAEISYGQLSSGTVRLTVVAHNAVPYRTNLPVGGSANDRPVADAGVDQSVASGTRVTLDGLDSFDPDGDSLTFRWSQTAGPAVQLSSTGAVQPWFGAPAVAAQTELTFSLVVSDGSLESTADHVTVTVSPGSSGWDLTVAAGDTPISIPDNNSSGIHSQLALTGSQAIGQMEVEVNITHTYIGDLRVKLECPDGNLVTLHDRSGGSANDINQVYPVTGCNGQSAGGSLRLLVSDHARIDVGSLDYWEVRINFDAPPPAWNVDQPAADTPIGIPDNDSTGISSSIQISASGVIRAMEVQVDITHTWIGDLRVVVDCPGGGVASLHDRAGGSADDIHQTFEVDGCQGQTSSGTFRLRVSDHARYDLGSLDGWRLRLQVE